ncbi:tetratricopeptide repeat protein [Thiocapsa imhoffii]|nr:tetratricopeptide repeat protein [Thiocapsa imhoffii]
MTNRTRTFLLACVIFLLAGCGAEDRKDRYLNRGIELFEAGDLIKARLEFRNALQIDDKDATAWMMLGQIEEDEQNWAQAFGAYTRSIELDPNLIEALVRRGRLLLAANQVEEARLDAGLALELEPENPDALVLRGAIERRSGDIDTALADIEHALALVPNHREGLVLLGQIRLSQDDVAGAIAATREAIDSNPNDTELLLILGGIYETLGRTQDALATLRQIIEIEPGIISHRQRLAGFLAQQGSLDEAIGVYRDAINANPQETELKLALVRFIAQNQSLEQAGLEAEALLAVNPQAHQVRFARAEIQASQGDVSAARANYRTVMDQAGLTAAGLEAHWRLAILELAQGNPDEAWTLAETVLNEDSNNEQALLIRASLALQREQPDQVIADTRTVMRLDPTSLDAIRLLAQAHLQKEDFALAQDVLQNAITLAPTEPTSYLDLARVRVLSGDLNGALSVLDELLRQVPGSVEAQNAIAQIQLGQQDWTALESSSNRILEDNPEHPLGYYLRGLLLERQGDNENAIAAFEASIERAPDTIEPVLALTRVYASLGRFNAAERTIRQLLASSPNNITASTLLAEILVADERPEEAREIYQEVIRFSGQAPAGYLGLAQIQQRSDDIEGAIATLRRGADATERNDFLLFNLAVLLQQSGQDDDAAALYEEILASSPGADVVANNLAMLLTASPDASRDQLERALDLASRFTNSTQPAFLDTLGWAQYRLGRYEQAATTLARAMAAGEPFAELEYHLGMAYLKTGREAEGVKLLQRAIESGTIFPGIEDAQAALAAVAVSVEER